MLRLYPPSRRQWNTVLVKRINRLWKFEICLTILYCRRLMNCRCYLQKSS